MAGYHTDIEKKSLENEFFREVLFTGPHSQLVVMALKPGEDIGQETHDDVDQFIRVEAGQGKAVLGQRIGGGFSTVVAFDCATAPLPAFARRPGFVF